MGITALDIKIRKSQRLTDNPDGGGRMVAAEVVDGELNNLFPDISTQDRVAGRVSMRKAFVHIDTANTDTLYGAVGVVMEPPEDDNVTMTMFSTGSYSDVRNDARNRIESYITKGVESRYTLYGDHFLGQRSISMYCFEDAPTPEINDTYALSTEGVGYVPNVQYIRVQKIVSRSSQTLVDGQGAYQRDVIIMNITTALIHDFPGQEVVRYTQVKPPTRIRHTNVADASSYYGLKKLTLSAAIGDLMVQVDSPYVQLVPATQAETPVVDVLAGMGALSMIQAGGTGTLNDSFGTSFSPGVAVTRYLGNPLVKGSVAVAVAGTTMTDDGRGGLIAPGASQWGGSVDYVSGAVSVASTTAVGNGNVSISGTPAGPVSMQGYTSRIEITTLNRQNNYVYQLTPLPSAGTVTLDYRALGKWIRLTDNGIGQLVGAPGQGSGTINYQTGSVTVTLGALPDLDSSIIATFGTGVQTARRNGGVEIKAPSLQFFLPHDGIAPSSVDVTWTSGSSPVTASDDGLGNLKVGGVKVGVVVYGTGEISLRPSTLPDAGSQLTIDYDRATAGLETFTPDQVGGLVSIDLGEAVRPGTVQLNWTANLLVGYSSTGAAQQPVGMVVRDDGAGELIAVSVGKAEWTASVGTIDYGAGLVTLKTSGNVHPTGLAPTPVYSWAVVGRLTAPRLEQVLEGYEESSNTSFAPSKTPVVARWQPATAIDTADTVTMALPPVELDLTPTVIDSVVPGSVRFTFRGRTYVDRSGSLYFDISPASGSGTYGGSMDYTTGIAHLTSWVTGGANTVSVDALLTRFTEAGSAQIYFRTPGAPLRPASFTLRATTLDGTQLTALADVNGNIFGSQVEGEIVWQSGSVAVRFGQMVTAAGNESEPWYDPTAVVAGEIWRPTLVIPDTVYFGTVVYSSIPLNPAILGLDPVRLPEDGRVVVFKPGQTVLVHHTQTTNVAIPAAAQEVDFGRPNLSRVEVRDSAGVPVDSIWYTVDKLAGKLTFSDPLNLAAYELPIVIRDRIEDRVLVADAQITGEVAINRPLAHAYPAGASLSTCLILGEMNGSPDLQGRVENVFDQATWTGVFSESRIGNGVDAQYNDVVYPLLVDNANAITERWAVKFTNATSFEVIGETTGIIATGSTSADCAPLNPRTSQPYFTIRKEGWGSGWSVGNVLRFNTIGGLAPVWFIRTTLAGEMEEPTDGFRFEAIGDANP